AVDVQVTAGSMKTDVNSGQTVLWGYGASTLTSADLFTFTAAGTSSAKTLQIVGMNSGGAMVRVFNGNGTEKTHFFAYTNFAGGVRVAIGDVTGDGIPDYVTAAGAGGGPHVKVYDGSTGSTTTPPTLIRSFFVYNPTFTGGIYLAVGDFNNDGKADIVTGAGAGGGPHVKVIDATKLTQLGTNGAILDSALLTQFMAYNPTFTGGIRVAAADVTGDGRADLILGAGFTGGPHVRVLNGVNFSQVYSFM